MCGIAGVYAKHQQHASSVSLMVARLKHRGPDGDGILSFPLCTLGHTRLSIIDIDSGKQPMTNTDNSIAVSFNGEIYGYKELRQKINYPYRTQSDTETILAAYEAYGLDFVQKLKGMFALALWDEREKRLVLARDRFGEKPLYYARGTKGEFIFASEIKAILASKLVDETINAQAMMHYMQYLTTPIGKTIYNNIYELPPAKQLVWNGQNTTITSYWELPLAKESMSLNEASEEFVKLFRDAVSRQMVADVEVGAFLSGGLDSTTVCIEAARIKPDLQTISYGFRGMHSELPFARVVSRQLHTRHHELEDDESIGKLLLDMSDVFDEPFADSSNIPMFRICQYASQRMKVVLSGDGADELLGGYDGWYKPMAIREKYPTFFSSRCPSLLASIVIKSICKLGLSSNPILQHVRNLAQYSDSPNLVSSHYRQMQYFSDLDVAMLTGENYIAAAHQGDTMDDVLRADIVDYMPSDILKKVDRTSMANGLEVRAPFLDVDLASFLISLPASLKVNSHEDKILLRKAYSEQWPDALKNRPKRGFGAPVNEWLKRPDMKEIKTAFIGNPQAKLYNLIDQASAKKYLENDNYQTWILLVLAIWAEKHG